MTDTPRIPTQFTEPEFTMPTVDAGGSPANMPTAERPAGDPPPAPMPAYPAETFGPRSSFPRPEPQPRHDHAAPPPLDAATVAGAIGLDPAPERCAGPCPPHQVCDACQYPDGVPDAPERDEEAAAATPAAAPPPPAAAPATPMAAGTYAVYDDGHGGVVLVLVVNGETHHKPIPAKIIKMGEMMMGGNNPLAALFGRS